MQFVRTRSIHSLTILSTAVVLCSSLLTGCATLQKGVDKISGNSSGSDIVSNHDSLDPLGSRSHKRLLLEDLSPGQLKQTLATSFKTRSGEASAQDAFANGKQLYDSATQMVTSNPQGTDHENVFLKAAGNFRTASSAWPDSSLAEDALFLEGESYFFANRYVQSNRAFEGLISQYSGSRYLDRAEQRRYAIAAYWLDLKKNGASIAFNDPKRPRFSLVSEAQRILHRIRLDDPTGKLADDATFALASSYLSSERFEDAADTFSYLRKDYPGSEYQFRSQMLELESLLKSYKGPDYDGTPLARAEKLQKQIQMQFPSESAKHSDILVQQTSLIKNQLVQRDYEVGQFYERRGENRAAKLYYEKAKTDFDNSVFENDLTERIAVVQDLPPVPAPPAQWVQKIFPDDEPVSAIIASRPDGVLVR